MEESFYPLKGHRVMVGLAVVLLTAVNVLGDTFAIAQHLPVWLDTFGTMVAGYVFGPIIGGVVGFLSHLLICIKDGSSTYMYAFANMAIGILIAELKKRGNLKDLFGFCNSALLFAFVSIAVSIPNTIVLRGGTMVNIWGNDIVNALLEINLPLSLAIFFGELYVDFVDKAILMYLLYFCTIVVRYVRFREKPHFKKMDVLTFSIVPIVIIETAVRKRFQGDFIDSIYFKNYIVVGMLLMVCWLSWFLTSAMQRRVIKKNTTELEMLRQKNALVKGTVLTIAHMVDAKDIYTAKHSSRVTKYSLMIGRELGMSEEQLKNLERSALLHDIGKVGVPDGILNKKGRLSAEEFQVMKTHPRLGYDILKDFDFAPEIRQGALYHHERYDGNGYPEGLAGEAIPLFGRIISIADAYDAMSSNRVYRPKCSRDYILKEFYKGRGTQFDPELCSIFLRLLEEGEIGSGEQTVSEEITVENLIERFGGHYSIIMRRLKSEEVVKSFLYDFLEDEEMSHLESALEKGDDRAAFLAVHTLKGISMNLEMSNLSKQCIALTENLRHSAIGSETQGLYEQVRKEYEEVCGLILQLKALDDMTEDEEENEAAVAADL